MVTESIPISYWTFVLYSVVVFLIGYIGRAAMCHQAHPQPRTEGEPVSGSTMVHVNCPHCRKRVIHDIFGNQWIKGEP